MKQAASFRLGICNDPACRALHFDLKDDNGRTFAQMNVNVEYVPRTIKHMQDLSYEIAVIKEPPK